MSDDDFLKIVSLTSQEVESAHIEVKSLQAIFSDYENQHPALVDVGDYIQRALGRVPSVHSTRVRVKTPISLIRKIVRKRIENPKRDIYLENYKDEIRDLIGLRAFHLFKDEWSIVHNGIIRDWKLHLKEKKPLAYIRRGDDAALQQVFKDAGCKVVEKDAGYRSVHYIIQTAPQKETHSAEIQVRTLFEEAWSEIDHKVRYPDALCDPIFNDYLLILNRLAGGADEMASLLLRMQNAFHVLKEAGEAAEVEKQNMEAELIAAKNDRDKFLNDLKLTSEQKEILQKEFDKQSKLYQHSQKSEDSESTKSTQKIAATRVALLASLGLPSSNALEELRRNIEHFRTPSPNEMLLQAHRAIADQQAMVRDIHVASGILKNPMRQSKTLAKPKKDIVKEK